MKVRPQRRTCGTKRVMFRRRDRNGRCRAVHAWHRLASVVARIRQPAVNPLPSDHWSPFWLPPARDRSTRRRYLTAQRSLYTGIPRQPALGTLATLARAVAFRPLYFLSALALAASRSNSSPRPNSATAPSIVTISLPVGLMSKPARRRLLDVCCRHGRLFALRDGHAADRPGSRGSDEEGRHNQDQIHAAARLTRG